MIYSFFLEKLADINIVNKLFGEIPVVLIMIGENSHSPINDKYTCNQYTVE